MPAIDGTLIEWEGRPALRFERTLKASPERVWSALTDADDMAAWHPNPFDLEAQAGGAVRYRGGLDDGAVIAIEPITRFAYTWGDDDLHWELTPSGTGTQLILTHVFDDRLKAARDGAGWDLCLDQLRHAVDAAPLEYGDGCWEQLNASYQEKFGIDPAEATPVPADHVAGEV